MTIRMEEDTKQLTEVVVKSRRHRYSRKNNPAVELMRRVVAARDSTRLENHDYYQYDKYQKILFALNDYKARTDSLNHRKFKWNEHTEISPYNGKLILPLSVDETVKQHVYRKNPRCDKDIIQGTSSSGINELMVTGDIVNTMLTPCLRICSVAGLMTRWHQTPETGMTRSGTSTGRYSSHRRVQASIPSAHDSSYRSFIY